ncbi:MAG: porin [Holophagales bacterium]|nr:porin [Holophagales bacterium]
MARSKEGRGAALLFTFAVAALAVALAPGAFGQEPAAAPVATAPAPAAPRPWYETISVNGFVTTSWSWNFNRPESDTNQYRVFDFEDNAIKIDGAELVLQKVASAPGEAGFRIDAVAGASIPRMTAAAGLFRDDDGTAGDFDLQQAYVSYVAPLGSGLRFDAGKYATHCGYEVIEGYDGYNDNATRSFLFGYAEPASHTGLKATYALSGTVSAMVEVVNGWDNVEDSNTSKSLGGQLAFTLPSNATVTVNALFGPERAGNDSDDRTFLNVVGTWKLGAGSALGLDAVWATEENAAGPGLDATWGGVALYGRLGLSPSFALVLRAEVFDDPDGVRTGTPQTLSELTFTPELKLAPGLVLRADLRLDHSTSDVFEKEASLTGTQPTVLLNALYFF